MGVMLSELVRADLILSDLRSVRKLDVVRELGTWLADHHPGVGREAAVRALADRERLGSTAIGDQIAIPHAKLAGATELIACLGRSRKGVDFDAPDGLPTHFFFVLLAPEDAPSEHLKALARISRLFGDARFRSRLMAAATAREMYRVLAEEDGR
jgi:PTS system nitrogen regulatory IIA component